jgi:VWFA-related protein
MTNFGIRVLVLAVAICAIRVAAQDVPMSPEDEVLRIDTQLVDVPLFVTDSGGKPLTGLQSTSFDVLEDGKKQEIASFSATEAPFEVALLLDTSGSTRADLELIARAAVHFIRSLRPGDRVAIVSFDQRMDGRRIETFIEIVSPLTDKREILERALQNVHTSNGTPFYDGLLMVAEEVFERPAEKEFRGRRALVALTDGVDSTSFWDFDRAKKKLSASGVASYFIRIDTKEAFEQNLLGDCSTATRFSPTQIRRYYQLFPGNSKMDKVFDFCQIGDFSRLDISNKLYELAGKEMEELAAASGGRVFPVADIREATKAFSQVANEIGTSYTLGYYSSNDKHDGSYRRITVRLKGLPAGTEVRAREGYTAPEN